MKLIDFLHESWTKQAIQSNDLLIMDNVKFHHTFDVKKWCNDQHITVKKVAQAFSFAGRMHKFDTLHGPPHIIM